MDYKKRENLERLVRERTTGANKLLKNKKIKNCSTLNSDMHHFSQGTFSYHIFVALTQHVGRVTKNGK